MKKTIGLALCVLLITLCACALADVEINDISFPDSNFRNVVTQFDTNKDGSLSDTEIGEIEQIYCEGAKITNLKGIEHLTSLKTLNCSNNRLTALDVSKNAAVTELSCSDNKLATLDVSKNTALTSLYCSGNQLAALDLSNNPALARLSCGNNALTALDVSKNTNLSNLSCAGNSLTTLDVSKNTALTKLECRNNSLTALDLSANNMLTKVDCSKNALATLNVKNSTALKDLNCEENQLAALDITNNTALEILNCTDNQLTALDVSKNTKLTSLYCSKNKITVLNANGFTNLERLHCSDNQLTALNISGCTNLVELYCADNQLTALNVSGFTNLEELFCEDNQLTALDVSGNTWLKRLSCFNNKLTKLDVSNCPDLCDCVKNSSRRDEPPFAHWMWKESDLRVGHAVTVTAGNIVSEPIIHTVTVTTDGNGTASASPAYGIYGTEVTLTATPNEGYEFIYWKVVSGMADIADNKLTIMEEDVKVVANFLELPPPPPVIDPQPEQDPQQPQPGPDGQTQPDPGPEEIVSLKKPKSLKLTAVSKKKIKVAWKKLSSKDRKKAKMIEIQISTDKAFTEILKTKALKSSKTSCTISGLKKNTKYYVRIRVYTKDGNIKFVSPWSSVKKIKTKKK